MTQDVRLEQRELVRTLSIVTPKAPPLFASEIQRQRTEGVSISDVKKYVSPEGVCFAINGVSGQSDGVIVHQMANIQLDQQYGDITSETEINTTLLRSVISNALENDDFISYIARKKGNAEISRDNIRKYIGISSDDMVERIYSVLNHGIDPELIPIIIKCRYPRDSSPEENEFISILRNSQTARNNLATLFTDREFKSEYQKGRTKTPYSEKVQRKIDETIASVIAEGKAAGVVSRDSDLKYRLEKFFNVGKYYNLADSATAGNLEFYENFTTETYFQTGDTPGWSTNRSNLQHIIIRDAINEYATSLEAGKYILSLNRIADRLLLQVFPEVYVDPRIHKYVFEDPPTGDTDINGETEMRCSFDEASRNITIRSGVKAKAIGMDLFDEETMYFSGLLGKRKIIDVVVAFHERAHATLSARNPLSVDIDIPRDYRYKTVDASVYEGFAVFAELLLIRHLEKNPTLLDLDEKDIEVLKRCRTDRLKWMKEAKDPTKIAYREGTLQMMNRIYGGVYKKGTEQRVETNRGLTAVRDFIDQIDRNKTIRTLRTNTRYLELLSGGDADQWRKEYCLN